jgi:small subunit ribosomal protein S2
MPNLPTMEEMLKAGLHFGHQSSRWHPKMGPYIYTSRNGLHVIDLKQTQTKLERAGEFVKKTVAAGGNVLFVGTKTQAQPLIESAAKECGMPYIKGRWIGGMLTNFDEVKKNIRRYLDLVRQREAGEWDKYTKKEQIGLKKEMEKLESFVSGLTGLSELPQAVFIVDIRLEKTALAEARVKGIPVVAICDTNTNPALVDYPIPGNDDATRGIELIVNYISAACKEGFNDRKIVPSSEQKIAPVKKKASVSRPSSSKKKAETTAVDATA